MNCLSSCEWKFRYFLSFELFWIKMQSIFLDKSFCDWNFIYLRITPSSRIVGLFGKSMFNIIKIPSNRFPKWLSCLIFCHRCIRSLLHIIVNIWGWQSYYVFTLHFLYFLVAHSSAISTFLYAYWAFIDISYEVSVQIFCLFLTELLDLPWYYWIIREVIQSLYHFFNKYIHCKCFLPICNLPLILLHIFWWAGILNFD